ncbi:hypothetical protein [Kamptonema formosum]|uniref:hypothetical protein n=1 Tax=Kamptonema formosum TaxID=331992 RepID=UPI000348236F|nr:hypothetical protein [Oscillatoria sp. PCC 10802]
MHTAIDAGAGCRLYGDETHRHRLPPRPSIGIGLEPRRSKGSGRIPIEIGFRASHRRTFTARRCGKKGVILGSVL